MRDVSRFRLQKSQVKFVYEIVLKYWRLRPGKRGRPLTLHPMVCLHMFLMRVASSMHLENIRIMFHVSSISSVWRACDRIMRIFTKPSVVRYFIRWPKANEREPLNAELFPRCPTALDGCHFRIHPPAVMRWAPSVPVHAIDMCRESYINFKGFPSILAQAAVLKNGSFASVDVQWPGKLPTRHNDGRVFVDCDCVLWQCPFQSW